MRRTARVSELFVVAEVTVSARSAFSTSAVLGMEEATSNCMMLLRFSPASTPTRSSGF
jgi:hypothetical protein